MIQKSLFGGFNNAVRAMQYAEYAITMHGRNIANAHNADYTRKAMLPAQEVLTQGPGVARFRDNFIDTQYRSAAGDLGESGVRSNILQKVEDIIGDPVKGGLRQAIDQFFDAWQGAAEAPSDGVARLQVLTAGTTFAQVVRSTYVDFDNLEGTVNDELAVRTSEVNLAIDEVFTLNKRISDLHRNNLDDADLRDQRDILLDKLAKLVGAESFENGDGTVRVISGSTVIVDGPTTVKLKLSTGNPPIPTWDGYITPTYNGTGTIAGLVSTRDVELSRLKTEIDKLAKEVATEVNAIHRVGYGIGGATGLDFFNIGGAGADIQVNTALTAQNLAVAADPAGSPSDGQNARLLARIGETPLTGLDSVITGEDQSPRRYYRNLVGWIGSQTADAKHQQELAKTRLDVTIQERQSDWGVSLDEEVAQLSLQQKAFAASARVISVMDELLDTLINRT